MGAGENFLRANREVWSLIDKHSSDVGWLIKLIKTYGNIYDNIIASFSYFNSSVREIEEETGKSASYWKRLAVLGLHTLMFQSPEFVNALLSESTTLSSSLSEMNLAKFFGLSRENLRNCLVDTFNTILGGGPRLGERESICYKYQFYGAVVAHIGAVLADLAGKQPQGVPRVNAVNSLVLWILRVIKDVATGSVGAGSIATLGASVGKGKTSIIYYTLRSVLHILGHPEPDRLAGDLIILSADDFWDVMDALSASGEKALVMVVDNASVIFPKQWVRMGGAVSRLFLSANALIDLIRGVSGATVFIANAPDELASFVRRASTLNIKGVDLDIRSYSATLFTERAEILATSEREGRQKLVRSVEKPAVAYVYPLLKLPLTLYVKDLRAKKENIAKILQEIKRIQAEEALGEEGSGGEKK
jgi:hypothetical protein